MKRFTVFGEWHKDNIIDEIRDNGDTLSIGEIVELLNELHEENQRLKFDKSNLHRAMSREEVRHKQFKDKIFCQIDCKIKQLKDCYMVNEAKIIEDLKEELIWND